MINLLKFYYKYFPQFIKSFIVKIWFRFKFPKLISSRNTYTYTDEHLKFVHILECINYLKVAGHNNVIPPVYFEFGCHSGRTFCTAVNASKFLGLKNAEYFAFDSFEGLPATEIEEDGIFKAGTFRTDKDKFVSIVKRKSGILLDDEHIIQGFFSDSLTSDLQDRLPNVGVVHIDVDLYSSAIEVLNFIKPLLVKGSIILFDDWYCFPVGQDKGERLALNEFCHQNPGFQVEEWKAYSTFGKSFFITELPSETIKNEDPSI